MIKKFIKLISCLLSIIMLAGAVPYTALAADAATIDAYAQILSGYANELNQLILSCEQKGLSAEYEKIVYAILNRWATEELVKPQNTTEAAFYEEFYYTKNPNGYFENYLKPNLDSMYEEAKANLNAYLNGTKTPKDVPKYVTDGDVKIDGFNMLADTVNAEGKVEKRPVYFVGVGHFDEAMNAMPQFDNFGFNAIQNEIGVWDVITKGFGWNVTDHKVDGIVRPVKGEGIDGSYALKFTYNAPIQSNVCHDIFNNITLEPNTTYILTFKVKGENVNSAQYEYLGTSTRTNLPTGTFDWTNIRQRFTTGTDNLNFKLWIIAQNYTDAMYIDNISLIKSGSTQNLIHNGTFDDYIPSADYGYYVKKIGTERTLKLLQSGKDSNVAVSLLISPHYFPDFLRNIYPDMYYVENEGATNEVLRPIISHPKYAEIMEAYVSEIIGQVKDYASLNNIVITNEPQFRAEQYGNYYRAQFEEWLKEKYLDDISALNKFYGTSYTAWSAVPMTVDSDNTNIAADNIEFNRYIFTNWHKWLANLIHKIAPDIPVHAKSQGYIGGWTTNAMVKYATDFELFNEWSDLAGLDYSIEWRGVKGGTHPPLGELLYYDYLAGVGGKLVINTEDHVYVDAEENFVPGQALHMGQNVWQGAVHHRTSTQLWVWRKSYDPHNIYYGSLLFRPDCLKAIGEASLDLNRLSYEVSALANSPEEVAVYYSDTSRLFDISGHNTAVYNAYEAMMFNGKKVKIVTDSTMDKLSGCKLLVIPECYQVPENVLEKIYDFGVSGGKIIISDTNVLAKNELNQAHSGSYVHNIVNMASVITDEDRAKLAEKYETYLKDNNLQDIWLVDASTGERVTDVEWTYTKYNDQLLVNICNYTTDYETSKTVKLVIGGETVTGATELRSGDALGESFTLYSNEPVLVSVPYKAVDDIDNLRASKSGTNVSLTWTSNDTDYAGCNIYKLSGSNLMPVTSTTEKNAVISYASGVSTYVLKAFSTTGDEADGVSITIADENVFTLSADAHKEGFGVTYSVTAQTDNTDASGVITVLLKDAEGKILDIAAAGRLVFSGEPATFSGSFGYDDADAAYVEFVVFDTLEQALDLSYHTVVQLN